MSKGLEGKNPDMKSSGNRANKESRSKTWSRDQLEVLSFPLSSGAKSHVLLRICLLQWVFFQNISSKGKHKLMP